MMDQLNSPSEPDWEYLGQPFNKSQIEDNYGFVYRITNKLTDKKYIGRKYFYSVKSIKGKGRKKQITESDWQKYWGSSRALDSDIHKFGLENFKREIISLHKTKRDVNVAENRIMEELQVLFRIDFYNNAIGMKQRKNYKRLLAADLR